MNYGSTEGNPFAKGGDDQFEETERRVRKDMRELNRRLGLIQNQAAQVSQTGSPELHHQMADNIKEAQQMAKNTNQSIKQLTRLASEFPSSQRKQTEKQLKKEFQEWLKKFQSVSKQSTAKGKTPAPAGPLSGPMSGPMSNTGPMAGPMSGYGEGPMAGYQAPSASQTAVAEEDERHYQQVQTEMEFNENLIADREAEIAQIEQSMNELNEIFRDLNAVVVDQGQMVDSIEENIETAYTDVKKGVEELEEAKNIQKGSKARWFALFCIGFCIVALIVCGLVLGLKKR